MAVMRLLATRIPFIVVAVSVLFWINADAMIDKVKTYKYFNKVRPTSIRDISYLKPNRKIKFWSGRRDCQDYYDSGFRQNGVYEILPRYVKRPYLAYCEMDVDNGYGWTVIQRRTDGSQYFLRVWDDYKAGFGSVLNEVWLGNEAIFRITNGNGRNYELLVELSDLDGNDYSALYSLFRIKDERYHYKLKLGKFLGGSANDSLSVHRGAHFSTVDKDYDDSATEHCGRIYKGGWWFKDCATIESNLNGEYYKSFVTPPSRHGVFWFGFGGQHYSYLYATMKIRPV